MFNTILESLQDYENLVQNPVSEQQAKLISEAMSEKDLVNMIVGATSHDPEALRKGLEKLSKGILRKVYKACSGDESSEKVEDESEEDEAEENESEESDEGESEESENETEAVEYDEMGNALMGGNVKKN